jgi:hypothetical protein
MSWVKRNLYFLIGSTVAFALLGLAGFYFYTNYALNNDNLKQLKAAYTELDELIKASPNPGNEKVNNIEIAGAQRAQVLAVIEKVKKHFLPIAPIPNPTNNVVTKEEFASALRRTFEELDRAAVTASVVMPPKYGYTFEAERSLTIFAPGSLEPLAAKLGEVRAICTVLFQARINSLDSLRRERVSPDDVRGPQSDFLDTISVTNQLAVMTPFEVVFHCFSTELAGVLAGFAADPHGFVIRAINIEPGAPGSATTDATGASAMAPGFPVAPPSVAAAGARGSLPVILDEKQLKVTLVLEVIKLLPKN